MVLWRLLYPLRMADLRRFRRVGRGVGVFDRHLAADVVGGALGGGSRADQHPVVFAEDLRPPFDVASLGLLCAAVLNASEATQKRRAELGYKFLKTVFLDAVAFGLGEAVQAVASSRTVGLMPISA